MSPTQIPSLITTMANHSRLETETTTIGPVAIARLVMTTLNVVIIALPMVLGGTTVVVMFIPTVHTAPTVFILTDFLGALAMSYTQR